MSIEPPSATPASVDTTELCLCKAYSCSWSQMQLWLSLNKVPKEPRLRQVWGHRSVLFVPLLSRGGAKMLLMLPLMPLSHVVLRTHTGAAFSCLLYVLTTVV